MDNILRNIKNNDKLLERLLKENYYFDDATVKMIIDCFDDKMLESSEKLTVMNVLKDKKFELEIEKFIKYVKKEVNNNSNVLLYLSRFGNKIRYGKYSMGLKNEMGSFFACNDRVISIMYLALKKEFGKSFVKDGRQLLFNNYYLLPGIGDKVVIEVSSNKKYDQRWFYKELFCDLYKDYNRELLRHNILYMMSLEDSSEVDKFIMSNIFDESGLKKGIYNKILMKKKDPKV